MGSVPSKVVRKLPRGNPSWAGSRLPAAATPRPSSERPLVFEGKNESIEKDAKDLHFMEKLGQLSPVRVDHHMQTTRAVSGDTRDMYRSRMRSEAEAAGLTKNRLLASSLTELLEARKSVTNDAQLETLAKQYHIDAGTLQRLGQVVNTPSIDEGTVVKTTDERGEESLTMMAHWIDPVPSRAQ